MNVILKKKIFRDKKRRSAVSGIYLFVLKNKEKRRENAHDRQNDWMVFKDCRMSRRVALDWRPTSIFFKNQLILFDIQWLVNRHMRVTCRLAFKSSVSITLNNCVSYSKCTIFEENEEIPLMAIRWYIVGIKFWN